MPSGNWIVVLEDGNYGTVDTAMVIEPNRDGDQYLDDGGDPSYMTSQYFNKKIRLSDVIEFYIKNKRGG